MKKNTMNTILSLIADIDTEEAQQVRAEITAELNKNKEKADANRAIYDTAREVVLDNLDSHPVTVAELYEAIEKELPDGFRKGKVQYALTHYWEDDVVCIPGKPNTYRRA